MQAISFNVQCLVNQTPEGVYWAAIRPRLDKNYVLYENEKLSLLQQTADSV